MATNYTRIAEIAAVESFDGAAATAASLVEDYPDIISIQTDETLYPAMTGATSLDPAETGVTSEIEITAQDDLQHANVVTITVLTKCITPGDLSLVIDGIEAVTVAVLDTDDTATKVATKVRAAVVAGWTASGTNAVVIFTQDSDAQADAVLAVLDHNGQYVNAYKDTLIVFAEMHDAPDTTTVWSAAEFAKYWVAVTP